MNNTILYMFSSEKDFSLGYAWSAELSRRLKASFSLFTAFDGAAESTAELYRALAEAESFYIKNFGYPGISKTVLRSERYFYKGRLENCAHDFLHHHNPEVLVLDADLLSRAKRKKLIDSGSKIIVLSVDENIKMSASGKNREQLFIDVLQHARLYNIPVSFFKTLSLDTSLFNYISSIFRK